MNIQQVIWFGQFIIFLLISVTLSGQDTLSISGFILDDKDASPLPFASVVIPHTTIGTTTNADGYFKMMVHQFPDSLEVQFLGYQTQRFAVNEKNKNQIKILLQESTTSLNTVEVVSKKKRYRRKGNPALALVKQVIAHHKSHELDQLDYYQFDQYDKVELSLINLSTGITELNIFNDVDFVFELIDTTEQGTPILPIYFQESIATQYFRHDPRSRKEYQRALQVTNIDDYISNDSYADYATRLYADFSVYDAQIILFDIPFQGPLSGVGTSFYRYYITDTTEYLGNEVIELAFTPANKYGQAFTGKMWILNDSTYQVVHAKLETLDQTNLNFVDDLMLEQTFIPIDGQQWAIERSTMDVNFQLTENLIGFKGRKTSLRYQYQLNEPPKNDIHALADPILADPQKELKTDSFWTANRPLDLTPREANVYWMIDSLQQINKVMNIVGLFRILGSGYIKSGPLDVGSVYSFLSHNLVEGWRFKVGGKTNAQFSERIQWLGYLAYGTKDRTFKYSNTFRFIFDDHFKAFPDQSLSLTVEQDNRFPGRFIQYADPDNFFLSFNAGNPDKMIGYTSYRIDYFKAFPNQFTANVFFDRQTQRGKGSLLLPYIEDGTVNYLNKMETSTIGIDLEFAPKAEYYESRHYRYAMPSRYPVFRMSYHTSLQGFLDSDYDYHQWSGQISKQFYLSPVGTTTLSIEGGKQWGKDLPYLLLFIPKTNLSPGYQSMAFNMMNFMEFVGDQYAQVSITHEFNGFFLNRIPLFNRLKWRESLQFSAWYGQLSDGNNPNLNPGLIQFSENDEGLPTTYLTSHKPYMEVDLAIGNVFKIFQFHFVKRLNYLSHPDVPSMFGVKGFNMKVNAVLDF